MTDGKSCIFGVSFRFWIYSANIWRYFGIIKIIQAKVVLGWDKFGRRSSDFMNSVNISPIQLQLQLQPPKKKELKTANFCLNNLIFIFPANYHCLVQIRCSSPARVHPIDPSIDLPTTVRYLATRVTKRDIFGKSLAILSLQRIFEGILILINDRLIMLDLVPKSLS